MTAEEKLEWIEMVLDNYDAGIRSDEISLVYIKLMIAAHDNHDTQRVVKEAYSRYIATFQKETN